MFATFVMIPKVGATQTPLRGRLAKPARRTRSAKDRDELLAHHAWRDR